MRFTERPSVPAAVAGQPSGSRRRDARAWLRMTTVAGVLSGCSSPMPPYQPALPQRPAQPSTAPSGGAPSSPSPPAVIRTWDDYRVRAAQRLIHANPGKTYLGEVPETLLAIPVLEIEVNADGSVKRIQVLRYPRQAKDTTQLAIDAVHRAAPFGDVARLPRPWKFAETFLFNDARQFKPRSLD